MSSLFDKLNLRPGERRLVVIVAITVFILLNAFFVWPQFGEGARLQRRRKTADQSLFQFRREVAQIPEYEKKLRELQKAGAAVASEDQALNLSKTIYSQAALSGAQVVGYNALPRTASTGKTNQFFDEQAGTVTLAPTEEKALIDFLYNLGTGSSMIRVRNMTLSPDPQRHKLQGSMVVVASYARRAPARAATPATTTAVSTPARTNPPAGHTAPARPAPSPNVATKKTSLLERLWPFGKKPNAPVKTAVPARTNAPPKK